MDKVSIRTLWKMNVYAALLAVFAWTIAFVFSGNLLPALLIILHSIQVFLFAYLLSTPKRKVKE